MTAAEEVAAMERAVDALVRDRVAAINATTIWEPARWELEPLTALATLWDERFHPEAEALLNHVGQRWSDLAEWVQAEPLMRRALAITEQSYGPDHPNVAANLATWRLAGTDPRSMSALVIMSFFGIRRRSPPNRLIKIAIHYRPHAKEKCAIVEFVGFSRAGLNL
jgi:hypothetical protein